MPENTIFKVTSNPILRAKHNTTSIMNDVCIALLPAICVGTYMFGITALMSVIASIFFCVFFEWGYCKLMKKPQPIGDHSAVVTGILLGLVLPAGIPVWVVMVGAFFAIVLVKQLYGGIGKNFVNPALAARAFLFSYPVLMTTWNTPSLLASAVDATTMATPLTYLYSGTAMPEYLSLTNVFLGITAGSFGEVSTLAILVGGIYLLYRGVITWRIPVSYLGTVAVIALVFGAEGYSNFEFMAYNLCSGGLMLAAFFMATDYTTSPLNLNGQLIFGVGCGVITMLIRAFGSYPEGVTYAILIMNICVWSIDKFTRPVQFGQTKAELKEKKAAEKAAKKAEKEATA